MKILISHLDLKASNHLKYTQVISNKCVSHAHKADPKLTIVFNKVQAKVQKSQSKLKYPKTDQKYQELTRQLDTGAAL